MTDQELDACLARIEQMLTLNTLRAYTVAQAARVAQVNAHVITAAIASGELRAREVPSRCPRPTRRHYRIPVDSLDAWLHSGPSAGGRG